MISFILNVLLVAITVVFLGIWGALKEQDMEHELIQKIHAKSKKKILKAYRKQTVLTERDLIHLIAGTKATLLWTRRQVQITDPTRIVEHVVSELVQNGILTEMHLKGKKAYRI